MLLIFKIAAFIMIFTSFLCLIRGLKGPNIADRIIVVNTISTKVVIILSLFSFIFNEQSYLDVALVYVMVSYLVTISVAKYKLYDRLL